MFKRTICFLSLIITAFLLLGCIDTSVVTTAVAEETTAEITTAATATETAADTTVAVTEPENTTVAETTAALTEETTTLVTKEVVTTVETTVAATATSEVTTVTTAVTTTVATTKETTVATTEQTTIATTVATTEETTVATTTATTAEEIIDEPIPTSNFVPMASGTATKVCDSAIIDYSNISDGYVMVQFTADTDARLKVQVKCEGNTYTYNITPKQWVVLPLSEGNGEYTVSVFQNVSGSKYATVVSATVNANITDETSVFLYPNQYVDFSVAKNAVAKAASLTKGLKNPLDKVAAIYDFVINTLTYDKEKADTVQSGYLPVLDDVLKAKKGICFDYAALMAGMLRSQGVPCKLVVGYAGSAYHAWINVWSESEGWINGVIFFNGTTWERMDPTFASASNGSQAIAQYIGDGKNYTVKYLY